MTSLIVILATALSAQVQDRVEGPPASREQATRPAPRTPAEVERRKAIHDELAPPAAIQDGKADAPEAPNSDRTQRLSAAEIERRQAIYAEWAEACDDAWEVAQDLPKTKNRRRDMFYKKVDAGSREILAKHVLSPKLLEVIIRQGLQERWPTPDPDEWVLVAQYVARLDAMRELLMRQQEENQVAQENAIQMFQITAQQQAFFYKQMQNERFHNDYMTLYQDLYRQRAQIYGLPLTADPRTGRIIPY